MPVRQTLERILRDPDDHSGQSIRSWRLQRDDGSTAIHIDNGREDRPVGAFLIIRAEDVPALIADLKRIAAAPGSALPARVGLDQ